MRFYLGRHCEAEKGPQLQPDRALTDLGKAQIPVIAKFLKTQTDKIGAVLCSSDLKRGIDTGEGIAKILDVPVMQTPWVDPPNNEGTVSRKDIDRAWLTVKKAAQKLKPDEELLVISHGPLVNALAAWLLGSNQGDKFHFSHGAVMHLDTDDPRVETGYPVAGRGKGVIAYLHWFASAKMMNRAMQRDSDAEIEEAIRITDELLGVRLDEKGRAYYYDVVNEKRFVPDATACEICEAAGDEGWVEDEAIFEGVFGDEDGPPLHPACGCELEYRERRYRVYESGERVLESTSTVVRFRT